LGKKPVFHGINGSTVVLELRRSSPFPDSEFRWSSLNVSPWKWLSGEELFRSSRTTLEQIAPWDILLLREIQD
jgi:hypothetical protein